MLFHIYALEKRRKDVEGINLGFDWTYVLETMDFNGREMVLQVKILNTKLKFFHFAKLFFLEGENYNAENRKFCNLYCWAFAKYFDAV